MRRILTVLVAGALVLGVMPIIAGANGWSFTYTGQITTSGAPGGVLDGPGGVDVDKFGTTYVVEYNGDVVDMYDEDGVLLDTWGSAGADPGELGGTNDVEVDRWGNVFVLERGNQRISVFNPAGQFTRHISGPGFGDTELYSPWGIALSLDGKVYVSDTSRIKVFTRNGEFVTSWDARGSCLGISCDQDGAVWAANDFKDTSAPDYSNTVAKYSPWGAMLASWGSTGTADGEFDRPYDVDVDGAGRVFVLDSIGGRVQAFDGDGAFLNKYSGAGATPSTFWWPYGVSAGFMREFRVADYANDRVVSFETTPAIPTGYTGVAGANRYATAAAASAEGWPGRSEYAIVATGLNWPDALSGAALAGACDGPLLLTKPNSLSPEAAAEVTRLDCDQVYILGGEAAVGPGVFTALEALVGPGNVHRLGGANRFQTSALIAEETIDLLGSSYDGTGIVVTGRDFPDALAVSPIAAANSWPVLLTEPDDLPTVIADVMTDNAITHGYVIGGESAVGPSAFAELDALWVGTPYRVSGTNRYTTSAAVAQLGYEGLGMLWSRPAIATGEDFPDALAGGVLQGSDYSVMLLTKSGSLHTAAAAALAENRDSIYELRYLGGTAALAPGVRSSSAALLH